MKVTICVIYPRFPDHREPLGGFVESEETAQAIDTWWRSQPGNMIGTWEDFDVEIDNRDQVLYGVFTGTPNTDISDPQFFGPVCHGIYTTRKAAEKATRPTSWREKKYMVPKFVLPFRIGWKSDKYYPDGKPWPPNKIYNSEVDKPEDSLDEQEPQERKNRSNNSKNNLDLAASDYSKNSASNKEPQNTYPFGKGVRYRTRRFHHCRKNH